MNEDQKIKTPSPLPWEEWQKTLALCYAQITMIDEAGGMVLDTLEQLGLADDTMVVWTTDHGDALACHGGHFDKSSYLPEEMIRVPMALRYPGVVPPAEEKSTQLVSNMDVAPTFLEAAGATFSNEIGGQSLLTVASDQSLSGREHIVCETHGHQRPHVGRTIVTARHKFTCNPNDQDEFYDLDLDPYELTNRIEDPEYLPVKRDLAQRLRHWQEKTSDPEELHL